MHKFLPYAWFNGDLVPFEDAKISLNVANGSLNNIISEKNFKPNINQIGWININETTDLSLNVEHIISSSNGMKNIYLYHHYQYQY